MSYTVLDSILTTEEDKTMVKTMFNERLDKPEILNKLAIILSDEGHHIQHIETDRALMLFRLAKEYFNSCWGVYLDMSLCSPKLDNLIQYTENTVYYVFAPEGERVATEKEVANGVEQLITKTKYTVNEDVVTYLNILLWTFNGYLRYYKNAGLDYTYTDGKLDDSDYQLICKAGQKLRGMIDWISIKGNYERIIATLKIAKKSSKYKYPSFAHDEISCEISPKQLLYLCKNALQGKALTETQGEVKRILFKIDKAKYKLLPHDIALMRKAYNETLNGIANEPIKQLDKDTQELVNRIKLGANQGLLNKTDFVFKIIETINKTGKCSEKQLKILREAEENLNKQIIKNGKAEKKSKNDEDDDTVRELFDLSEALGKGSLEG